jgi:exonuclease III
MPVPSLYRPHIPRPSDSHHDAPNLTALQRLVLQQQQRQQKPTPRPLGLKLATYNIQDGRNSRLVPACRALQAQNIDMALLTEARIPDEIHTRHCLGYNIFATYTTTRNQGGIALAYRQGAHNWHIESLLCHGPNILSCILVSGTQRTPLIEAYLPPSNLTDLPHLTTALDRFPNEAPLLLGDLNVDLLNLRPPRNQQVAEVITAYGLEDMLHHFQQRKAFTHQKTWWQNREGKIIRSRCDYILGTDRRLFETVSIRDPRYFTSDHYMLVACYLISPTPSHKLYLQGRKRLPLQPPTKGPLTQVDMLFQEVKANCPPRKSPLNPTTSNGCQIQPSGSSIHGAPCAATHNMIELKPGASLEPLTRLSKTTGKDAQRKLGQL